jgi:hypothetical protein
MHAEVSSENLKGRDHLEDLNVDGKIVLEWILWKLGGKVWSLVNGYVVPEKVSFMVSGWGRKSEQTTIFYLSL